MNKLNNCPFCQSDKLTIEVENYNATLWHIEFIDKKGKELNLVACYIRCENCFAQSSQHSSEETAINKWNEIAS